MKETPMTTERANRIIQEARLHNAIQTWKTVQENEKRNVILHDELSNLVSRLTDDQMKEYLAKTQE